MTLESAILSASSSSRSRRELQISRSRFRNISLCRWVRGRYNGLRLGLLRPMIATSFFVSDPLIKICGRADFGADYARKYASWGIELPGFVILKKDYRYWPVMRA